MEAYNVHECEDEYLKKSIDDASCNDDDEPLKTFDVRVDNSKLSVWTGPGINYSKTGKYTGVGVITIVDVEPGKGSNEGWGKLKSGAGWVPLDFVKRI